MESDLLIREYERIRHILRDFYIFGCFTKADYINKRGVGESKYDKEQKKINAYLPDGFIHKKTKNRNVIQFCKYNMFKDRENYIANTFRCKTFTDKDITSYFYILQFLNGGQPLGASELSEKLNNIKYGEVNNYDRKTIRPKLGELLTAGYITSDGHPTRPKYSLKEDILKDFTNQEIEDMCIMLELVKNKEMLQAPFLFLQKKLELYLYYNREIENVDKDLFLHKHSHLFNVLDNEIVIEILRAIEQKSYIEVTLISGKQDKVFTVIPVKIIHDMIYGRQYLFGFSEFFDDFAVNRIDRIKKIEIKEKVEDDKLSEILEKSSVEEKLWCTSSLSNKEDTLVKIEFKFDEEEEYYILNRIKREGQNGKVTRLEQGRYLFEIEVKDPQEMIPWIRSFGERAKIIESGDFEIEERIVSDWRELLDKYGDV
ncbi:MAG: helix-turn-helix transcriptional regulator [Intestinibacter sp.]